MSSSPAAPQSSPPPGQLSPSAFQPSSNHAFLLLALALAGLFIVSTVNLRGGMGFEPIDAWVAQTSREMSESGDWRGYVVPKFSGETRMQKSPGPYWAVCAVAWLRGGTLDEMTVRIPNVAAALLLVATVFWLTREIAGDRAAAFAAFTSASTGIVLYWANRGASDLGVTSLMAFSLACLWIGSEKTDPGWRRVALWLLGYFAAGLAMLYKMPMPLVCIGLPVMAYVLIRNRWTVFASWWHLVGLALFLLPWLPWAAIVTQLEPNALYKWKVEYLDRATGELPNVEEQKHWKFYFLYIGVALAFSIPYCFSVPIALARPMRAFPDADRRGIWFLQIWFWALFAFFTASTGKETRYFLPAMPPLLCLLGCELSAFFDPARRRDERLDRWLAYSVIALVPAAFVVGGFGLHKWHALSAADILPWSELLGPYLGVAVLFSATTTVAALCYARRREGASFATLVGGMWLTWIWTWGSLAPIVGSQAPLRDFAAQLRDRLDAGQKAALRQVAQQDSRVIWYSDVRFPRVIEQLKLLEMQSGKRDAQREMRLIGEEIVRGLEGPQLSLFVAGMVDYATFQIAAPPELAAADRAMPPMHLWLQSRVGRADQRYVLFGNQPPPWDEPALSLPPKALDRIRTAAQQAADRLQSTAPRPQPPATAPASSGHSAPASTQASPR